jgi:hypothetical protein
MYKTLWPTLGWPAGTGKAARDARAAALRSADRVLERIGRENYRDALDACHLLLVEPTDAEAQWLDKAKTIYALVDTVTGKVNELRERRAERDANMERNKRVLTSISEEELFGPPPEPQHPAWWGEALDSLRNSLATGTYETYLQRAMLLDASNGTVTVGTSGSHEWANDRLARRVCEAIARAGGGDVSVVFAPLHGAA